MRNKSAFLTVMAIFTYFAYLMWQGIQYEGYSLLRLLSLGLILLGMALMLFSKLRTFLREVNKSRK